MCAYNAVPVRRLSSHRLRFVLYTLALASAALLIHAAAAAAVLVVQIAMHILVAALAPVVAVVPVLSPP
jgi:hypothetical protein